MQITQQELDLILMRLIDFDIKQSDAPCSAYTSWCEAITILSKYANMESRDPERLEVINNAKELIDSLTGNNFSTAKPE